MFLLHVTDYTVTRKVTRLFDSFWVPMIIIDRTFPYVITKKELADLP